MAITRCSEHPPDPELFAWELIVEPVGYPDTALLCPVCFPGETTPGYVYLKDAEATRYEDGRRVFKPPSTATRIHVTDSVYEP